MVVRLTAASVHAHNYETAACQPRFLHRRGTGICGSLCISWKKRYVSWVVLPNECLSNVGLLNITLQCDVSSPESWGTLSTCCKKLCSMSYIVCRGSPHFHGLSRETLSCPTRLAQGRHPRQMAGILARTVSPSCLPAWHLGSSATSNRRHCHSWR